MVKIATHNLLLFMVTAPSEQSASPLQPEKTEPGSGVAMRVTEVPLAKFAEQVVLQLIPAGPLVTTPLPVPAAVAVATMLTVSLGVWTVIGVKVAVQVLFVFIVTEPSTQSAWPLHPENV